MRGGLKAVARACARVAALPSMASYAARRAVLGPDRALQGSSQALALLPGLPGQYIRRAFLAFALDGCAETAVVEFGTTFSRQGARLDDHVYVGPFCTLGLVHLERDVLVASGVQIPSGPHTHGTSGAAPIREQPGARRRVRVGAGTWIGTGAVVTAPIPDGSVAVGVPARVVRARTVSA